jgi:hypothetical protein
VETLERDESVLICYFAAVINRGVLIARKEIARNYRLYFFKNTSEFI